MKKIEHPFVGKISQVVVEDPTVNGINFWRTRRLIENYGEKFTQTEMAEKMGVSITIYNSFELGTRVPSYEKLEELCKLLDVTPSHLYSKEQLLIIHNRETFSDFEKGLNVDLSGNRKTLFYNPPDREREKAKIAKTREAKKRKERALSQQEEMGDQGNQNKTFG